VAFEEGGRMGLETAAREVCPAVAGNLGDVSASVSKSWVECSSLYG
jgi:hypothetical protein